MEQPSAMLTPRYEVRKLELEHLPWVLAVFLHSGFVSSPLWSVIYPEDMTKRIYEVMPIQEYIVRHQIESGLSFGVFDLEYQYKRPESALTGGKLYWDVNDTEATTDDLLEQMDFPLVSFALGYDGINPLDPEKVKPLILLRPLYVSISTLLKARDKRDPALWKPKGPGEVLIRNGTATRADYRNSRLMKLTAHWVMHAAARKGFRGIQIESAHDGVTHVWMNPPEPFKAELVCSLDTGTYEEEVDGKKVKIFAPAQQLITRIYVTLKTPTS